MPFRRATKWRPRSPTNSPSTQNTKQSTTPQAQQNNVRSRTLRKAQHTERATESQHTTKQRQRGTSNPKHCSHQAQESTTHRAENKMQNVHWEKNKTALLTDFSGIRRDTKHATHTLTITVANRFPLTSVSKWFEDSWLSPHLETSPANLHPRYPNYLDTSHFTNGPPLFLLLLLAQELCQSLLSYLLLTSLNYRLSVSQLLLAAIYKHPKWQV